MIVWKPIPLSLASYALAHDAAGNLVLRTDVATGAATEYTWDHRNRLTQVKFRDASGALVKESNYTYDVFDRRLKAIDQVLGGSTTTLKTVYDGGNVWADYDSANALTEHYLSGRALDQLFARLDGTGAAAWYLTDQLGSVRDLADLDGNLVDHVQYASFGSVLAETNPSAGDRFKFTAREYDSATGDYFYRARYYNPSIGRFISQDPIGFAGEDVNLQRYVWNTPTTFIDPVGHTGWALHNPGAPPRYQLTNPEYREGFEQGMGRPIKLLITPIIEGATVWDNTKHLGKLQRLYVTLGTVAGTYTGVRGLSDAGSRHDAVDAHEQTLWERIGDAVVGGIGMLGTGLVGRLFKGRPRPSPTPFGMGPEVAPRPQVFPRTAEEMDDLLGFTGTRVKDLPTTPGRNKVIWKPNENTRIILEQHPYDPTAPAWHSGPHFHIDLPGAPHKRFLPGDPIP